MPHEFPICPYCNKRSKKVKGDVIYPHRSDLKTCVFYHCAPCKAYVGCHKNSDKPLGRLANAELRAAKSAAHIAFDPLWKDGHMNRTEAYIWLAKNMEIHRDTCHIGMFDLEQCAKVVALVNEYMEQA